jgi:hypothetical protein
VDDRVEFVLGKKLENVFSITNVETDMLEILRRRQKTITIPRRVALLTKKHRTHIVVDSDNFVSLTVEERDGLRPDEPA